VWSSCAQEWISIIQGWGVEPSARMEQMTLESDDAVSKQLLTAWTYNLLSNLFVVSDNKRNQRYFSLQYTPTWFPFLNHNWSNYAPVYDVACIGLISAREVTAEKWTGTQNIFHLPGIVIHESLLQNAQATTDAARMPKLSVRHFKQVKWIPESRGNLQCLDLH
jgi:hypothetical protein